MNPNTVREQLQGPVGHLDIAIDQPFGKPLGTAIVAHPHPLFGGTMDNKVVQTMARALVQCGWRSVRFNFRGVGGSQGEYADGVGERDDLRAVAQAYAKEQPMVLAGFSFGSAVASQLLPELQQRQADLRAVILVGTAVSRFEVAPLSPEHIARALVVHGEVDETVPLSDVMNWARPQGLPVTVVPGGEHFFHGRLPALKQLVVRHLNGVAAHSENG